MIQPPRRGKRRGELAHRRGDDQGEEGDQRPAQADRRAAHAAEPEVERGHSAGQDADDRERDREVREPAQPPGQLLGIAQRVQPADVVIEYGSLDRRPRSSGTFLGRFQHGFQLLEELSAGPAYHVMRGGPTSSSRCSSQAANSGAGRRPKSRRIATAS